MSSQIIHTQSSTIHPLAHVLDTCALICCNRFISLSQLHHVTSSHPLQLITTNARGGGPKEHQAKQKCPPRETNSVAYAPGLFTLSYLSHIVSQPPPLFLCFPRPPSHHPSCTTSDYLVPDLRLLLPSTLFWSYPMPLLRTTPFVQLVFHIDTSWPLFPFLYCSAHLSVLPTLSTPHSFCVPHPFHILH